MASPMCEETTKPCDPCQYQGIQKLATSHCVDCSEDFCDSCSVHHESFKATRGHNIEHFVDSYEMTNKQKAILSSLMTCSAHPSEALTDYCNDDQQSICTKCLKENHRNCNTNPLKKIDQNLHIIDKEKNLKENIDDFLQKIRNLEEELNEIKTSRQIAEEEVERNLMKCRVALEEFKDKIMSWLQTLEKDMLEQVENVEKELSAKIQADITTSNAITKQLNDFEISLKGAENTPVPKMEELKVRLKEAVEAKEAIVREMKLPSFNFQRSPKVEKMITELRTIGTLETDGKNEKVVNFLDIQSAEKIGVINVNATFAIDGCTFMSNGELVICGNEKVHVFTPDFKIKSELKLGYNARDVVAISPEEVIVSDPVNEQVQILDISNEINKGKMINLGMACYGLDFKNEKIYVSCKQTIYQSEDDIFWRHDEDYYEQQKIKVIVLDGDSIHTMMTIRKGNHNKIAVCSSGKKIFASTDDSSSVWCSTEGGTRLFTYVDSELRGSEGLLIDSYDNFMVCGGYSNNIHVVNEDGLKQKIILSASDGLQNPQCMAFRESDKTLVIGQRSKNSLLIFKLH